MEYKKMHWSFKPTVGCYGVTSDKLINDLVEPLNYIGTFSEYNPIDRCGTRLFAYVYKKNTASVNQQKEFKLSGFKLKHGGGYHSSYYNSNHSFGFTKQDLLRIAHAMNETDTLIISNGVCYDISKFDKDVEKVIK